MFFFIFFEVLMLICWIWLIKIQIQTRRKLKEIQKRVDKITELHRAQWEKFLQEDPNFKRLD
jgi:hypothetical protein